MRAELSDLQILRSGSSNAPTEHLTRYGESSIERASLES